MKIIKDTERTGSISSKKSALLEQRLKQRGIDTLKRQSIPPRKATSHCPLSFAQQRLWFLHQLEPESTVYLIPMAMRLKGILHKDSLEYSLKELVQRHESLRTNFVERDGQPVQIIREQSLFRFPIVDLRFLNVKEQERETRRLGTQEAEQPCNLIHESLLRITLLQLTAEDHVLLVTLHHIISDGWSMQIFRRELNLLYQAYSTGRPSPLESLPIQYADFTLWQRQWLQGQVFENQMTYWRQQLVGASPLELPTDYTRPSKQTFRGNRRSIQLPASLHKELLLLSQQEDVTVFMLLLAAFFVLLARYSGQNDICIGAPIANRVRPELENLIGFFVNTLVMRADLSGNPTFRELLARVRKTTLDAYDHQDMPFEQLVDKLQPERDLSRSPLFQIMFNLQHYAELSQQQLEREGALAFSPLDTENTTTKFDLTLFVTISEANVSCGMEYSTDLFKPNTIDRLLSHWQILLESIVAAPQTPLDRLPLLSQEERQLLLVDWNTTQTEIALDGGIHELFEQQALRIPDSMALTFGDACLTYAALDRAATQAAQQVQAMININGQLVGLCIERSFELVIGLLAILKTGNAYVPMDPTYPQERLAFMLQDSQAAVVVTQSELMPLLPTSSARMLCLAAEASTNSQPLLSSVACHPEQAAYVIYTSGSTGRPKGTIISHSSIANFFTSMCQQLQITAADRILAVTSFSFDISALELLLPLTIGASIHIASRQEVVDAVALAGVLTTSGATILQGTPSMWRMLITAGWAGTADLKILCGGEALSSELANQLVKRGSQLWNMYGPTETTIWSAICRFQPKDERISIGRAIANTQLYVLDRAGASVPIGVIGELSIGGSGVAQGYWHRPELTAEKFLPDVYSQKEGMRMYQTGDRVRWLENGSLEFLGRVDQQVKIRGHRIELGEIEEVLRAHPALREGVVIARSDTPDNTHLVAYFVPDPQYQAIEEEKSAWKEEHITQWQMLWSETYRSTSTLADPTFNIIGWNSSYTGEPIPENEMREQVEQTVARILARRPQTVLEIGFGTGLLLFGIAPYCTYYRAVDFSEDALHYVQRLLPSLGLSHVDLSLQKADEVITTEEQFDTVLLNSVVQYFPNISYFLEVLTGVVPRIKPGGFIFIGDLRSLPLLQAYSLSVELHHAPSTLSRHQLRQRVLQRMAEEEELLIDPAFFLAFQKYLPQVSYVQILLKRGRTHNELMRFRYDVVLRIGAIEEDSRECVFLDWQLQKMTVSSLEQYIQENIPDLLHIRRVPNMRLSKEIKALEWMAAGEGDETVDILHEALDRQVTDLDLENLWLLGERLGYTVTISWSPDGNIGYCNVVFRRGTEIPVRYVDTTSLPAGEAIPMTTWLSYGNDPLQGKMTRRIIPHLRAFLKEKLPDYMMPAIFIALDHLPLTPNGKVDRRALPVPQGGRGQKDETFVAPRHAIEEILAALWCELLDCLQISIHDNFFEVGGHSLLATQLLARVKILLHVQIPLHVLFDKPTIADLSRWIGQALHETQATTVPSLVPMPRTQNLPLSFAQQRFWFLHQLEPQSTAYLMTAAQYLRGALDTVVLIRSIEELVRRHEVLRTTFPEQAGQPLQVIHPAGPFSLPVIDLQGIEQEVREHEMYSLIAQEAQQPCNLADGPLLRLYLLWLGHEECALLITLPHIIFDGWSTQILQRELKTLYNAYTLDQPSPLPLLPIQYADFALWQRQWLQGQVLESQLSYWKQQLANITPLDLPTDHLRPRIQTYQGASQTLLLSPVLSEQLRILSQRHGVTLFMFLLAAFQTLLACYTGQTDIAVGTPIANRTQEELEGLIGCFVNTLVLRSDLSGNPPFTTLLQRVREVALGAYAHQDIPFEQLVEQLQPERNMSLSPLFQVMFSLQQSPSFRQEEFEALSFHTLEIDPEMTKFDLSLFMRDSPVGLDCVVEYSTHLFERSTIHRLLEHWKTLLEGIVIAPQTLLGDLPLLTSKERHLILQTWNDTGKPIEAISSIHQLFERQSVSTPDVIAVVAGEQMLTYAALNIYANQVAHYLSDLGVRSNVLVGFCVERSLEMMVGLLGILKAGGAYVPMDPSYPQERLLFMMKDANIAALLTMSHLWDAHPLLDQMQVCLDSDWEKITQAPRENIQATTIANQLAYTIYTSGSTGIPKGVMVNHHCLLNFFTAMDDLIDWTTPGIWLAVTSVSFDISILELFWTLARGFRVIINAGSEHLSMHSYTPFQDDVSLCGQIIRHAVTHLQGTPSLMRALLLEAQATDALPCLQNILVGGEAFPLPLAQQIESMTHANIWNMYGPTETTVWSATHRVLAEERSVPIGRPIANTQLYILDKHMQLVPIGVYGELYIGGEGVTDGYWCRPELTAERFLPHPFTEEPGLRLYRTGDRVRSLPDGMTEYVGRIDHQVKLRGFRIELGEIEAALQQHDMVQNSVVVLQEGSPGDMRLIAYVEPGRPELEERYLRQYLQVRLPGYMLPSQIILLATLPLTPNGKIDRAALPVLLESTSQHDIPTHKPTNAVEEMVHQIWCDVLARQHVSIDDDFFDLGGHSLLATQVISRVRTLFKVELPLRTIFEAPTISALAQLIEQTTRFNIADEPPIVPTRRRDAYLPLSFAQQRLWFLDQLEPNSPVYNIMGGVRLRGPVVVHVLQQSLLEIVQRHESLRTTFQHRDDVPVQVIEPHAHLHFRLVDLRALAVELRETAAQQLGNSEAEYPFDLRRGPLLRSTLLQIAQDEYILLFTVHHIISDGWSIQLIERELVLLYDAAISGQVMPLPPLPIQYADFTLWQRQWLQGQVLESQLAYWTDQLSEAAPLNLPTDYPRTPVQTFRGASQTTVLSHSLYEQLQALSRQEGITLFMLLVTTFQILLSRYSGQMDVTIGTPVANRNRQEVEGLIGLFTNTLVLRMRLSGNPSFREVLVKGREIALSAYAHQDLPFEKIVEALQIERDLDRSALFQVMFILQQDSQPFKEIAGITFSPFTRDNKTAKFDLTLLVGNTERGFECTIEYNNDLFKPESIARLLGYWQTILESIVVQPDQRVMNLPIVPPEEKFLLLQAHRNPTVYTPSHTSLLDLLAEQLEQTPDAIAACYNDTSLSYTCLHDRANVLATVLCEHGVGSERPVAVLAERSLHFLIAMLAIWKASGTYLPLDPLHPVARLQHVLRQSRSQLILVDATYAALLQHIVSTGTLELPPIIMELEPLLAQVLEMSIPLAHHTLPDQLAYVIYTSGSTGTPKGVMVEQRGMLNHLWAKIHDVQLCSTDRIAQVGPQGFDVSIWQCIAPLLQGACVQMIPDAIAFDPRRLLALLEERAITLLQVVPSMMRALIQEATTDELSPDLAALRWLIPTGEALPVLLCQQWLDRYEHTPLLNTYGSTECSDDQCHYPIKQLHKRDAELLIMPIGFPIGQMQAYVLDGFYNVQPIGVMGELYIGGVGVGRGYLDDPERTAQVFVPDPFGLQAGARLYKTGDVVRYLADGNVEFVGRRDHMVKMHGYRIELEDIEEVLGQYPGMKQCLVQIWQEDNNHKNTTHLVAYMVSTTQPQPMIAEVRSYLYERLPAYMLPTFFIWLEALPLSANGKVDRRALPAPTTQNQLERRAEGRSYQRPMEEVVAGIWKEVLEHEQIDPQATFFEQGGHSLLATKVIARLNKSIGVDVPLRRLFEVPTLVAFARSVEQELSNKGTGKQPDIKRQPQAGETRIALSFAQQRLWFLDQLEPDNVAYIMIGGIKLKGYVDRRAVEKSLSEIIQRHDSLRTVFRVHQGEPIQMIEQRAHVYWRQGDLRGLRGDERERELKRLIQEEAEQGFDLQQGGLIRSLFIQLDEQEQVLLWTMHHIVSDGWSMEVFTRELSILYQAFAAGRPSPLTPLPIQYTDFTLWQHQWLRGEVLERLLNYWTTQLNGAQPVQIPIDRPRPAILSNHGATHVFTVPQQLSEELITLSRQKTATLFMTLLTAFQILLYCYSGQQDITVGTDVANRTTVELEEIIGFFVNLLALRTHLNSQDTFTTVLNRVRIMVIDAYAHQDFPFEKIVEALQLERTSPQVPLVNVLFVMQNVPLSHQDAQDIIVEAIPIENRTAKFDMAVFMRESKQGLTGFVNYRTDLFDSATITRLFDHFKILLQSIVSSPDIKIGELQLYTEEEKRQQLNKEAVYQETHRQRLKTARRKEISASEANNEH